MTITLDRPAPPPAASAPERPSGRRRHIPLAVLLVATAIGYSWNLSVNGWANSFYAAAIQAGSQSWKAFLFGSSDMANSITVDKPPASLWLPALSARIFGLNSWSILLPQVAMGVATVALVYAIVRRYFGVTAGMVAGTVMALTPIAAVMFRFDNPDSLLLLLLTASVWATLRALSDGRTRWMVVVGVCVGFAFLTKQLQAFLVIPPIALTYLVFGPSKWWARLAQLFAGLGAMIVAAGWWLLTVQLWPASSRPYIGGSQNNSIWDLTFGYNGFGRLNGDERGSVGGGRSGADTAGMVTGGQGMPGQTGLATGNGEGFGGFPGGGRGWGETGFFRMFQPAQGGQIAWLIPTALILSIAALVLCGKKSRSTIARSFVVLNLLWLIVTMAVFSYMAGIFHPYYTVALAAPIAALIGGAGWICWSERDRLWVRITLSLSMITAGAMAFWLLGRSPDFVPWLRWIVIVVAVVAGLVFALASTLLAGSEGLSRRVSAVAILAALVAGVAGPTAYIVDSLGTAQQGAMPSAGPSVEGAMGFGGMRGGQGPMGMGRNGTGGGIAPLPPNGQGGPGQAGFGPGASAQAGTGPGSWTSSRAGRGGMGGLLGASKPSQQVIDVLNKDADRYTWVAAAIGSNNASGYQLALNKSVMPVGGFNGTDPSPTLDAFKQMVNEGKIHYFIASSGQGAEMGGMGMGRSGTSSSISSWVESTFTAKTVDGVTLYDLTSPK